MLKLRFKVGTAVMCNLGPSGWKLGRIIALNYRETRWPEGRTAPYQVALDDDHTLIYVPEDSDYACREATPEDLRITHYLDALAPAQHTRELVPGGSKLRPGSGLTSRLNTAPGDPTYRLGLCQGCEPYPRHWSSVELYSQHYRAAERHQLKVTHHTIELGTLGVGDFLNGSSTKGYPVQEGFLQCPTLVRLPPGIRFSDDGSLSGQIQFDPHRDTTYHVQFVAVSTSAWNDETIGLVRLEATFTVTDNTPPPTFDTDEFHTKQERARTRANELVRSVWHAWQQWEQGTRNNRETCDEICAMLGGLRNLLEEHPRLDDGMWWAQLGGFYMNVHKLLENTLLECELYLGHALTFGNSKVRQMAERNLEGCYQKRLLEAARFMWMDGLKLMMRGAWSDAVETLESAASKKDGWGWAVNYGDIWLSEAAARIIHGVERASRGAQNTGGDQMWQSEAAKLLEKGVARSDASGVFGPDVHPWASEIAEALTLYHDCVERGADVAEWLEAFQARTLYWCAQVLAGAPPFPPKPRPRLENAAVLIERLHTWNS